MDAPDLLPEHPESRDDGPMTGTPRELLDHWIELYRTTLLMKIGGLSAEQLCERPAPPSTLSLLGLVRHLTEVESYWVREVLEGDETVPDRWCTPENPDGDFDDVSPATAFADVRAYRDEVDSSRETLARWDDLTALAHGRRRGRELNLGWILTHLVEEYARHLGHADLLRERLDGRTGY